MIKKVFLLILVLIAVFIWRLGQYDPNAPRTASAPQQSAGERAFELCKNEIAGQFGDPPRTLVPAAKDFGTPGKDHYFAWGNDNKVGGYGSIDSKTATLHTASCITNAEGTSLSSFTFDAKTIR